MVGIRCVSLSMAPFALRLSTQIRISPSGFGTTTRGDVHSVGPHGTSSMMYSCSSSSNFLSTLPLRQKGGRLTGWATGLTFLLMCDLSWKSYISKSYVSKVLQNISSIAFFGERTCQWVTKMSDSQYIHLLCSVFSKQSFSRTFNNSELIQTAFCRIFTVNFSFKCSQHFN